MEEKQNQDIQIQISYLQIYCEAITDLLAETEDETNLSQKLSIREKKNGNIYVEGLRRYNITSVSDFTTLLERGDLARSTASTNMNETSSRSHAVLLVYILNKVERTEASSSSSDSDISGMRESVLVLVDLAGSERASASEGKDYMRLEEAKAINLSLSALGNCMSALAEGKSRTHIPYRDSKLTRLLQSSLGGSSRTAVVVNIPPREDSGMETLSALRFAARASKVKVAAKLGKVSVQRDYEALYVAACKRIDQIESEKLESSAKEEFDRILAEKNLTISQQAAEIESLRGKLTVLELSVPAAASAVSAAPAMERDAVAISKEAAASLQAVEELRASFQKQLLIHKNETTFAARELSELQDELNSERKRHLSTMQDMRAIQEKKIATENALRARIEELLAELSDKRTTIDELNDVLKVCQERVAASEAQLSAARRKMEDMVSKEQVKEMETLFLETVSQLSSRVQLLEAQKTSAPSSGGAPSSSSSSSVSVGAAAARGPGSGSSSGNGSSRPNPGYGSAVGLQPNGHKVLEPGGRLRITPQGGPAARRPYAGAGEGYQADSEYR